jgi:hypothetical protein
VMVRIGMEPAYVVYHTQLFASRFRGGLGWDHAHIQTGFRRDLDVCLSSVPNRASVGYVGRAVCGVRDLLSREGSRSLLPGSAFKLPGL